MCRAERFNFTARQFDPVTIFCVSPQRVVKTSSPPQETTLSRRSPRWPDAEWPWKGERAGLRFSSGLLLCKQAGLVLFEMTLLFFFFFSCLLSYNPNPPAVQFLLQVHRICTHLHVAEHFACSAWSLIVWCTHMLHTSTVTHLVCCSTWWHNVLPVWRNLFQMTQFTFFFFPFLLCSPSLFAVGGA